MDAAKVGPRAGASLVMPTRRVQWRGQGGHLSGVGEEGLGGEEAWRVNGEQRKA